MQTIKTEGGPKGSFTLAFGELDSPLPGTVDTVHGVPFLVTSEDLTPYVKRGDRVRVGGLDYAVHAFRPFNATHMYLAKVRRQTKHTLGSQGVIYRSQGRCQDHAWTTYTLHLLQ